MAAITLEVAKKHLEMWLEAESEVAINNRREVLYKGKFGRNPQADRILE